MGDLTKNLSKSEFACNCTDPECRYKEVADIELVQVLQQAVDDFAATYAAQAKIQITSGNRCIPHNKEEGGEPHSKHTYGIAADHKIFTLSFGNWVQVPAEEQFHYYDSKYPNKFGLGLYPNRVHLDVRKERARWTHK